MTAADSQRPLLVTGATGMLGAAVVAAAAELGPVVGTTRSNAVAEYTRLDVTDDKAVAARFRDIDPWAVIHCAAETRVDAAEADPARAQLINVDGTRFVASAAAERGARLIYVSTDAVFDGQRGSYTEDDEPAPINEYGRTKLAGERAAREELDAVVIVRTNIYGYRSVGPLSLLQWILAELERGARVPGFVDVTFSPLYVGDLGRMLVRLASGTERGVYNAGSADSVSKFEFARLVAAEFGFDPALVKPANLDDSGLDARRPRATGLNSTKLARVLGRPMPTVLDGIKRARRDARLRPAASISSRAVS